MNDMNIEEISNQLHIPFKDVKDSDILQKSYYEVKNNNNLTDDEKEAVYKEMERIFKIMLQKNFM